LRRPALPAAPSPPGTLQNLISPGFAARTRRDRQKEGNTVSPLDYLISAAATLLVVVDPIGLAPTFLSVTAGLPRAARRNVAVRAVVIAGVILTGTALIGDWLLRQLGITLPAFRIAGGLLLFSIAYEMVLGVRTERQSRDAEHAIEEHVRNVAAFPLAIPLLAGPGAITATVLLAGQAAFRPLYLAILIGVIAAIAALSLLVFWLGSRIAGLLGATGSLLLSRLLGVLLAALAVQFVIDGIRSVLGG
jgi:multiple antibiotic resistance protein